MKKKCTKILKYGSLDKVYLRGVESILIKLSRFFFWFFFFTLKFER